MDSDTRTDEGRPADERAIRALQRQVLDAWGAGRFVRPHGIFISSDDRVFLTDDEGHTVHEFAPDGTFRRRLGDGRPSDTGFVPWQSPVTRAAGPFNTVTNVALAPAGEIYAADGSGNARGHRFAADGRLLASWGERRRENPV